jgi:hypothetical protein
MNFKPSFLGVRQRNTEVFFLHSCTVHVDVISLLFTNWRTIELFWKNIKIYIKTAATCFGLITIIRECIILVLMNYIIFIVRTNTTFGTIYIYLLCTIIFGRFRQSSGRSHNMLLTINTDINKHNGMTTPKFAEKYCEALLVPLPLHSLHISVFVLRRSLRIKIECTPYPPAWLLPNINNWILGHILWRSV